VLFASIIKNTPEKVFINVYNNEASTDLIAGDVACWELNLTAGEVNPGIVVPFVFTSTNGSGVKVIKSPASVNSTVAGVATKTIPFQTWGLLQVYGFHGGVKASGAITAAVGTMVKTGGAAGAVTTAAIDVDAFAGIGACVVSAGAGPLGAGFVGVQLRLL
jgi:hypothetical protein